MTNIINVDFGRKEVYDPREKWKQKTPELGFESIANPHDLESMISSTWKRKEILDEMQKILDNSDNISILKEEEIKKYSFLYMINKIIEQNRFTSELHICSDYISQLITKQILNYIDIEQNIIKLLQDMENPNFQQAGDIQLLRYMVKYEQKRKNPRNARDLIQGAEMYYKGAYNAQKREIGKYMYENLDLLQEIVDIRNLLEKLFPTKILNL